MELRFTGKVQGGRGGFRNKILLPDASRLYDGGWIGELKQGTFNIRVQNLNLHTENEIRFQEFGVRKLDLLDGFPPQVYLRWDVVPHNTITPSTDCPQAGDLQFWRAQLTCVGKTDRRRCYMLRRVNSGYHDTIELLSDVLFREEFGLVDGDPVDLRVFSIDAF